MPPTVARWQWWSRLGKGKNRHQQKVWQAHLETMQMTISLLLPNVFFQIDAAFGQPQPARDLVQGQQSAVWGQPAPIKAGNHVLALNQ